MKIKTNNTPRHLVYGYELTKKEAADFDYLSPDELNEREFVRYRGRVYDMGEFMRIDKTVAPHPQRQGWGHWHGYSSDSFFSGVLVRFSDDGESVVLGTYFC